MSGTPVHRFAGRGHRSGIRRLVALAAAAVLFAACVGSTTIDAIDAIDEASTPDAAVDGGKPPLTGPRSTPAVTPEPGVSPDTTAAVAAPTPQPGYRSGAAAAVVPGGVLSGRRVGLIANSASTVEAVSGSPLVSTIDLLAALPDVELVAIFAPEHGPRGDLEAGQPVPGGVDAATGVTVHSLYGETRAPTPAMLEDVDVLVYDLQGVGARFYTFISTLGLAMQAANEAGIEFVVLDRPNPQGGRLVSGPLLDPAFASFVGQYPIPMLHGLTAGELARAIVGERWLPGLDGIDLTVVEMQHWSRSMTWPDLDRTWVPPSPGLPTAAAARIYPGTVLFESTSLSYGRGTEDVFAQVGAPWIDAQRLASDLASVEIPGVRFEPVSFVPRQGSLTIAPAHVDVEVHGVRWEVTGPAVFDPVEAAVAVLVALRPQAAAAGVVLIERPDFLDLLAGGSRLRDMLDEGEDARAISSAWIGEVDEFSARMAPYRLYD